MDQPTREMLRPDVALLDVPTVPKPALASAKDIGAYAPIAFTPPVQGMLHPPLDPDASNVEIGRQNTGDPSITYVVASGPTTVSLNID